MLILVISIKKIVTTIDQLLGHDLQTDQPKPLLKIAKIHVTNDRHISTHYYLLTWTIGESCDRYNRQNYLMTIYHNILQKHITQFSLPNLSLPQKYSMN